MLGIKPKVIRVKKTVGEKIEEFAEKALLKAMKDDPEVVRQYVMKQFGIDIRTPGERAVSQVVEQTRQRVIWKVADEIEEDPDVREAMRDKLVAELGISPHQHKAREGSSQPRGNYHSQMNRIMHDIDKLDQIKERLGANSHGWSDLLKNPEVIKGLFGIVQWALGCSGLTPATATAAESKEREYYIEKDGELIQVDFKTYVQHRSKQKGLESPAAAPMQPDQNGPIDKPAAAKRKPKFWLPPTAPPAKIPEIEKREVQEVVAQPTSLPPNGSDTPWVFVSKIVEAMDKPVGEFVKKTVASYQAGDKESLQIKDFLLAYKYDDILKELPRDCGFVERFEKSKEWYDQVTEALRTQL